MEYRGPKEKILDQRIQQIEITPSGIIKASDHTLFVFKNETSIASYHPFFEGIAPLFGNSQDSIKFPCVNLSINNTHKIVDIEIITLEEKRYVLLIDFTIHYQDAHPLIQEKNEATIAKNTLFFEKKLLEAKEEFKNNFLANLNHEIRTPLNSMLGFIDILGETKLNYDQHETLKVIQKTGVHLKMLMDDMLDISRIEQGILNKKHVNFHLGSILSNLQNHFDLKYIDTDVILEVSNTEHMLKTYKGDPVRLNQILFNLIDNAFKHIDEGEIRLNISSKDIDKDTALLTFKIADTGKNNNNIAVDKAFDSYYQLQMEKEQPLGEGLGLKIVKDLVELLNGSISVKNSEKEGAVFIANLPFEKRNPKREKKTVKKGTGIFQSKRILIVEDEATDQMLFMKTFLNNDKGYVIEIASDGNHALDLLQSRAYDVVILKRNLPDISGLELLEKITENASEENTNIPMIMASANSLIEQQQAAIDKGAATFLSKPYTKNELFNTIEKLIR